MIVHDLIKVLPATEPEPMTPEWLLKNIPPELMAGMLAGVIGDVANLYEAANELEQKADFKRQPGTFSLVEAFKQLHSHASRKNARVRTAKYNELAALLEPFWNSDRHKYRGKLGNDGWAEAALALPLAVDFMKKHSFTVGVDAVATWPNRHRWNPEAKKGSVS